MTIEKCTVKIKCDCCNRLADFALKQDLSRDQLYVCKNCAESIYKGLAKIFVPQAIEAPFKKLEKIKERK